MYIEEAAADLLERTADAFESGELRWCQGSTRTPDGRLCAVGALRYMGSGKLTCYVNPIPAHVTLAHEQVQSYLGKIILAPIDGWLPPSRSLAAWNDHTAKNVGEVIDVFKQTAKDLRNDQ